MNEGGEPYPQHDADQAIADLGQPGDRAEAFQQRQGKDEQDLYPGIAYFLGAGGDLGGEGDHQQRQQQADEAVEVRHDPHHRDQRQQAADRRVAQ